MTTSATARASDGGENEGGGLAARIAAAVGGGAEPLPLSDLAGQEGPPKAALNALYASHALARWAWRTWEFAVALVLIRLHPDSLVLVSAYGLADNFARVVSGGVVGRFVDRAPRFAGASSMYLLQNGCILGSAAAAGALLLLARNAGAGAGAVAPVDAVGPAVYWPLVAVCVALGSTASAGSTGAAAAVEREWVATLCARDGLLLARVNAAMRAIDMLCLMLAPVAAGCLMTYVGALPAVLAIACYSLVAWAPQLAMLRVALALSPALRAPKAAPEAAPAAPSAETAAAPSNKRGGGGKRGGIRGALAALALGWPTYLRQPTLLPSLALALLYLTVLSLGFLMTAYLRHHGYSEAALSLFRTAGAVSGLAATVVFPRLHRAVGLDAAGAGGIGWMNVCLIAGSMPAIVAGFVVAGGGGGGGAGAGGEAFMLHALLCGVAASRFGVWLFDLAVSQMQQERARPDEIGTVTAIQTSIQSFFEIASFVAGALLPNPTQFHWLMLLSLAAIAAAALLYGIYVGRRGCFRGGDGEEEAEGALDAPLLRGGDAAADNEGPA